MKKYNEVEGILYSHYRKKSKIGLHKGALARTQKRIKQIKVDLINCNIDIKDELSSIDYSKEKITTSKDNSSSMERALIRAESKLERELKEEVNYLNKLKGRIRGIQKEIDNVDIILEDLIEDDLQIIEKKYSGRLSENKISNDMNMDRSTVTRKKRTIIEYLQENL